MCMFELEGSERMRLWKPFQREAQLNEEEMKPRLNLFWFSILKIFSHVRYYFFSFGAKNLNK